MDQDIKDPAPQIKTRAEREWKRNYRTDLDVRDLRFIISEPEKIGGRNEGRTPMEYFLGALRLVVLQLERVPWPAEVTAPHKNLAPGQGLAYIQRPPSYATNSNMPGGFQLATQLIRGQQ